MRALSLLAVIVCIAIALTSCESVSKPYVMQTDRVDQKMDIGNRGYLKGAPPPAQDRSNLKRPFIAVDIDLVEGKDGKVVLEEENTAVETKKVVTTEREETIATFRQEMTVKEEDIK